MATQGVTLDKVSIEIQSSSSQASQDIDRLTTSLTALRGAIKGGFNGLNKLASSLNELATSSKQMSDISANISKLENVTLTLQELSNIPTPTGFKAIVKGLNDLKIASDNLGDTDAKLSGIPKISENLATLGNIPRSNSINSITKNLERLIEISPQLEKVSDDLKTLPSMVAPLSSLQSISVGKGLSSVVNNLERIPEAMQKFDSSTLENVARVSTQLASALTPVGDKFRDISAGASSLSEMANKYGIAITKVREKSQNTISTLNKLKKNLTDIGKGMLNVGKGALTSIGGHAVRSFKKAASKAKQLTLALIGTRTIFTLTRKAVSEYLALDQELSKFSTNIWRALGAQLAPAIEYVMGLFKQFVRVIYSFVYAITGIDLIARANAKAMAGWSKSAKDALGNLQKFDDLNVVEFPKSSGDGPDLIDMDKIDLTPIQWLVDAVIRIKEAFKEAFDTGQWKGVGKEFANLANDINARLIENADLIFGKITKMATNIGDVINGWFENINAEDLAKTIEMSLLVVPTFLNSLITQVDFGQIGTRINESLQAIDFQKIITQFGDIVINLIKGLQEMLFNIDPSMLANTFSQISLGLLDSIYGILDSIEWGQLGSYIHDAILSIDWVSIFNEIINIFETTVSGLGSFFDNLFGTTIFSTLSDTINDLVNNIVLIGTTIMETLGEGTGAGKTLAGIEGIFDTIIGLVGDIGDYLTQWIISDEFQSVIQLVSDIIGDIFDFLDKIFKRVSDWWNSEGGEIVQSILTELTKIVKDVLEYVKPILNTIFKVLLWAWDTILRPLLTFLLKELDLFLSVARGIVNFIVKIFQGDIKGAFQSIGDTIQTVAKKFKDVWKSSINFVINLAEGFVNAIIGGLNWLIKQINKISFSVPSWVPGVGGKKLGFNLGLLGTISIPRLSTGTNEIPKEGIYHLHPGEAVVPKKYNPAIGNNGSEETNKRLDTLIYLMENMEMTNIVNVGNETLYKKQQAYNKLQNNKYGTINV